MGASVKVGIVGGTGYTGAELLRLLAVHPDVRLTAITSRHEAGTSVAEMFPNLRGQVALDFSAPENTVLNACDVVFFATPHGVAMAQARALLEAKTRVIDLAADFRLQDARVFKRWYNLPHTCPELLGQAVYGIPELNRDRVAQAHIVGNPGCYPTAVLLGLAPLLENGASLVETHTLIADCKSGASGAGRKAAVSGLYAEVSDNFKAYGLPGHRHHPEIVEQLQSLTQEKITLSFVPHLVPMIRGMFATLYARITPAGYATDFQALYEKRYANEAFIDVMPANSLPETRSVRASNHLRIALHRPDDGDLLIILVIQDNLVKGAAGQAVQNMNIMFGLPETAGLGQIAVLP